mmetsp:Transcript_19358/g.68496  ORF Transcript_19358/g.68496 Transcript_19358/m.68496 type:complete len:211 (+) Transcript_19358:1650-2282(+)
MKCTLLLFTRAHTAHTCRLDDSHATLARHATCSPAPPAVLDASDAAALALSLAALRFSSSSATAAARRFCAIACGIESSGFSMLSRSSCSATGSHIGAVRMRSPKALPMPRIITDTRPAITWSSGTNWTGSVASHQSMKVWMLRPPVTTSSSRSFQNDAYRHRMSGFMSRVRTPRSVYRSTTSCFVPRASATMQRAYSRRCSSVMRFTCP